MFNTVQCLPRSWDSSLFSGSSVVAAGSSVVAALKKQFSEGDSPSTREEREPLTTTPLDSVMEILVSDSQETVFTGV